METSTRREDEMVPHDEHAVVAVLKSSSTKTMNYAVPRIDLGRPALEQINTALLCIDSRRFVLTRSLNLKHSKYYMRYTAGRVVFVYQAFQNSVLPAHFGYVALLPPHTHTPGL